MAWSCDVCTFENRNDDATRCEICETKRGEETPPNNHYSKKAPPNGIVNQKKNPPSKSVQSTLFGDVVKLPEKKKAITMFNKQSTNNSSGQTIQSASESIAVSKPEVKCLNPPAKSERKVGGISKQDTIDFPLKESRNHNNETPTWDAPFSDLKVRAKDAMKKIFGVQKLRFLQPIAVKCALQRKSQIIIMATGGGKSLCYQLPAVVLGGTTVVISPLIALMKDQVQALIEKGVEASFISSNNGEKHNSDIMERLAGRDVRSTKKPSRLLKPITILYVTPEQVQTSRFRDILKELDQSKRLTMFAVDEAHCLSSWGHDFRKSYMQLDYLRLAFPDVPLMACTATATPAVLEDIKRVLHLEKCPCHLGSYDRPNIFYAVKYKDALDTLKPGGSMLDLVSFIKKQHKRADDKFAPCSGIIYCHTRQETSEIANTIRKQCAISCVAYHAGLKVVERNKAQEDWTSGVAKIAVATVAFGMGIDLGPVRYVVHWTLSKNIASFYQESGRAGRDGLPSFSVVYYSKDDASKFQFLLMNKKKSKDGNDDPCVARDLAALEEIVNYCVAPGCRRHRLLSHFGEKMDDLSVVCRQTCDYCVNPDRVKSSIESAMSAKDFSFYTRSIQPEKTAMRKLYASEDNEEFTKPFSVNGLGITQPGSSMESFDLERYDEKPNRDFAKASCILSKYEAIECKGKTGFVSFKQKAKKFGNDAEKIDDRIRIPQHLIPKKTVVTIPAMTIEKAESKTSEDFAAEADRLRVALAEAKAAAELRRHVLQEKAGLNANSSKRPPPAAPPPPAFAVKRKR